MLTMIILFQELKCVLIFLRFSFALYFQFIENLSGSLCPIILDMTLGISFYYVEANVAWLMGRLIDSRAYVWLVDETYTQLRAKNVFKYWGMIRIGYIVFSVFFSMLKFKLPTIFLAQNFGFYGFLKNKTWFKEAIFSSHQYVRCEQDMLSGWSSPLISSKINNHHPLKSGDGWVVEPRVLAPLWTWYQRVTASWTKFTGIEWNLVLFHQI
jgi:hypothetical protein